MDEYEVDGGEEDWWRSRETTEKERKMRIEEEEEEEENCREKVPRNPLGEMFENRHQSLMLLQYSICSLRYGRCTSVVA